jgi:DNA-binding CsgD family transcriptional regulator
MATGFGAFDKLTEGFAAAALDPRRWNEAMNVAAEATDSYGAILVPLRGRSPNYPQSDSLHLATERYVHEGWIQHDERYRAITPKWSKTGVCSEFDFTTPEEMARSPYYQEFLGPSGLRWFAGVKVGEGEDVWVLSLQRSVARGPFSSDELDQLSCLSRCLAGAAKLACAFGLARIEGATEAFEASGEAVVVVNRHGEVVGINRSAERLLGADLQIVGKRLASADRDATAALDRALWALIWAKGEAFQPPVVLPRRDRRPIVAYASRLFGDVPDGLASCSGFIVLVDLDARLSADAGALMQAFGLTPAEARLVCRLLHGECLETAAARLGVAIETVRNQLKCVYEKTDTHRQAELIALISRLTLRVRHSPFGS